MYPLESGKNLCLASACRSRTECPLEKLKVAVIGGLERLEDHYRNEFRTLGAECSFHPGYCAGLGSGRLRRTADNADVVVFITTVNSHNALRIVKAVCRKSGKAFVAMRETGPKRVSLLVAEKINAGEIIPTRNR